MPQEQKYIVVKTIRPTPGRPPEKLELSRAGLYEADFGVPDWLVPDFRITKQFARVWRGKQLSHLLTSVRGPVLTVRFRVDNLDDITTVPAPETEAVSVLTVGAVVAAFAVALGAGGLLFKQIAKLVKEVRVLLPVPVTAAVGIGAAVLLVGTGIAKLRG